MCAVMYAEKFWIAPWDTSTSATTDRNRQQDVQDRPDHVLPEVAQALAAAPDDPPDQRDRDHDPDPGREEVLNRQPGHLAEVGHRRLAAVVLPVRVRQERRRGVERDVPRGRVEVLRVEPSPVPQRLRAQDEVQEQPADEREDDQALGVRLPVLAAFGVDAHDPVQQTLGDAEHGIEPRVAARVDGRHVTAERECQRRQRDDEQENREPAEERHRLRTSRRAERVDEV